MENYLIAEYELNEKYHDSKEKVIWVAFTLYYTYSLGLIKYILDIKEYDKIKEFSCLIFIADVIIFFISLAFLYMQMNRKYVSVLKTIKIREIISKEKNDQEIRNWFSRNQKNTEDDLRIQYRKDRFKTNRFEILLFSIMFILFLIKEIIMLRSFALFKSSYCIPNSITVISVIYYIVLLIDYKFNV